jgi:SAM-dependent methyltransferase/uncharacterized protein YbaR (Trm112 family)
VCPACRQDAPLAIGTVVEEHAGGDVREAVLVCSNQHCQREHPIIDGIPIVVSDLQSWATHQLDSVLWRTDLSAFTESLLGDAAGPNHALQRHRQTLSAYGRVHWGDFDREDPLPRESSLAHLLASALELADKPAGTWIDLGCAVGRATYELARYTGQLAVGADLSFGMLRVAERARTTGCATFPLRRVGLVYDRRDISIPEVHGVEMSFWCCDVDNLPFPDATFDGAVSLNVLDCVASPVQHLVEMGRVLPSGARAVVCSPYDWSPAATPLEQWLGGHSQRGAAHGSSPAELRRVLATLNTGLTVMSERDSVPWRVYVNERASMDYLVHAVSLERTG